ncbi:MAG: hypothetical protein ACYST5_00495 [Planctomycetota bacterium]|jgi:hypothetical protein
MEQFDFSEGRIRKKTRNILIVFPFVILCLAGFALSIADYKVKVLIPLSVILLIMTAILVIEKLLIDRSLRKMKVLIYEDKIIKQCGKHHQIVLWNNIIKIKLNENPEGSIVWIRLYRKNERVIYLNGFDEMEKIANLIKGKISDNVLVQTKRQRLDWENPIVSIITVIATMAIMGIVTAGGIKTMNISATLFALCVGSMLLIFRPLTKANLSMKWVEIIVALFMIITGIYGFIVSLFAGKFP